MQETRTDSWVREIAGEGVGYPLQNSGLEKSMGLQRVGHDRATFTSLGVSLKTYLLCLISITSTSEYCFGLEHHLPFPLLEEIRKAKYPTKAKTSNAFHLCSKESFIQYGRKPFLWDGLDHRHRMAWAKLDQAWFSFVG